MNEVHAIQERLRPVPPDSIAYEAICRPDIPISWPNIPTSRPDIQTSHPEVGDYCQTVAELLEGAEPEEDPWKELTNRQKAFLFNLLGKGSLLLASIGVCQPSSHFAWLRACEAYAVAYEDVKEMLQEKLVAFAHHLALFGERVPLFYKGSPCLSPQEGRQIYETRRDNRLLVALIKPMFRTKPLNPTT